MLLASCLCQVFLRIHGHIMAGRMEEYQRQHGIIEVPEALGFMGMALSVQLPFILLLLGLQFASFLVVSVCSEIRWDTRVLFWLAWFGVWGMCIL